MNAGAYGGEMKDVVEYSDYYDPATDSFGRFSGDEQGFSYRKSAYSNNENLIILGAAFKLKEGDEEEIRCLMNENMSKRREKQPLEYPSAGSVFKRPVGYFAGQLIEECGLKGKTIGGAMVSEKHAGFIVNTGDASAGDVLSLVGEIQSSVFSTFGVRLMPEVEFFHLSEEEKCRLPIL